MKSYTDLEQSKKLAEILPIESADQTWVRVAIAGPNLGIPEELQYRHNGDLPFEAYSGIGIPCWSLAALIDILPAGIKNYTLHIIKDNVIKGYFCSYRNKQNEVFVSTSGFNVIDAVFEMIVHLKEIEK